ncbi:two-component regulator propeller domain-containing protein, partial [Pseudomonas sp. URIL14HWK12:I7]
LAVFDGTDWTVYNTGNSPLPVDWISALAIDAAGRVWIGTMGGGFAVFDGTNWTVYNTENSGLPSDWISALAIDAGGSVWIGTNGDGLVVFDGTDWTVYNRWNSGLPSYGVNALAADAAGRVWIGRWGLTVFDGTNWTVYTPWNSGLPSNMVYALAVDAAGRVWIGTSDGLAVYQELILPGDVSGDGQVTVTDVVLTLRYIVGLITLSDTQKIAADFNQDGKVNITDAVLILRSIVGGKRFARLEDVRGQVRWGRVIEAAGRKRLPLVVEGASNVYGLELQVALPEGVEFEGVEVPEGWLEAHRVEGGWLHLAAAGLNEAQGEVVVLSLRGVVPEAGLRGVVSLNGVKEERLGDEVPVVFGLEGVYPNPVRGEAAIRYALAEEAEVRLVVYDAVGREVRRLVEGMQEEGEHRVVWDGRGEDGRPLAAGVYFVRLETPEYVATKKIVLVK